MTRSSISAASREIRGTQNYEIPADVDIDSFRSISIWCRRFSVGFGVRRSIRPSGTPGRVRRRVTFGPSRSAYYLRFGFAAAEHASQLPRRRALPFAIGYETRSRKEHRSDAA